MAHQRGYHKIKKDLSQVDIQMMMMRDNKIVKKILNIIQKEKILWEKENSNQMMIQKNKMRHHHVKRILILVMIMKYSLEVYPIMPLNKILMIFFLNVDPLIM